jgi:transposase
MAIEAVIERAAGLDIAKASLVACVRVPDGHRPGRARTHKRVFATTTAGLLQLADWLAAHQIQLVGMESTGQYWKPVFYLLEAQMECWLLNPRHMRAVPGRKTDMSDAEWICDLVAHGLVRPSFVPPPPIRRLRDLTRRRTVLTRERAREKQRMEKLLEDAAVKLSAVASDILGVSARAIITALAAGEHDGQALATRHAKGRLRRKIPALAEALTGRFDPHHHGLIATQILAHVDFLDHQITDLTTRIEAEIAPYQRQVDLLDSIPGVDQHTAQGILAEIGADTTRFPTARHLVSWAGLCPGNNKTGGKSRPTPCRPGNKWLKAYCGAAAYGAIRKRGSYANAQYRRIAARRGGKRAQTAVAHSLLDAAWHILTTQTSYHDLGGDYFLTLTNPNHRRDRAITVLQHLGYRVTLEPTTTPPATTAPIFD